jgi:hypothetical protein
MLNTQDHRKLLLKFLGFSPPGGTDQILAATIKIMCSKLILKTSSVVRKLNPSVISLGLVFRKTLRGAPASKGALEAIVRQ